MKARRVGDLEVSELALGGAMLGLGDVPRERAIATVHAAVRCGITLFDSAAAYVPRPDAQGDNERLFRSALDALPRRDGFVIATKGGHYRDADGFPIDGRPERIKADCERSLRALGREVIDLYFLHWPDPKVPFAESVGALSDLRSEGKIRLVGLSNVSVAQLDEALGITAVAAVQNHFSLVARDRAMLDRTSELGIAYLAYSPLRGATDVEAVKAIAERRGSSPQQVVLAWELAQASNLIPIVGSTRPETISDSAGASELELTAAELAALG
jgi:aryl-alcohol dehydrogenase-like predicted oxidoreductase